LRFWNKVSFIRILGGLIVGVMSFRNEYDGLTINAALDNTERLVEKWMDVNQLSLASSCATQMDCVTEDKTEHSVGTDKTGLWQDWIISHRCRKSTLYPLHPQCFRHVPRPKSVSFWL
jgi:hypothetical protein